MWHYLTRGAGDDRTVHEAQDAWNRYRLRPRVLRDVTSVSTGMQLFGAWQTPIGIAPTAFHAVLHPDGEVATATGAVAAGAPMVLSSRSTRRIEDVAAAISGPWWFQVYLMRERSITAALIERAAAAGATAMVLTADTPYVGHRARTAALSRPLPLSDEQALTNVQQHLPEGAGDYWDLIDQRADLSLGDIGWVADIAELPVVVKGVLRGDEAAACVDAGADAVWVSNHGGRQLDRAISTAAALPEVVAAVAGSVPVIVDGGVRDGFDALVALALGASAVMLGRPVMWALAAEGAAGVTGLLDELTAELRHAMGLAGAARLADLDRSLVTGH
ncbi:alpha-hydroxy-acid oxidizing protein [Flexivirga caeni]|uniref:Alpha-hydroxy-acid oxidizing protein n=2 Tax=Flexivirga caeni TaxID=2294115 RepID=A0A3M9LZL6_9MICO|nr:alpha-hydroxy-acid oxidizing protein [Flexivirga caeni]